MSRRVVESENEESDRDEAINTPATRKRAVKPTKKVTEAGTSFTS